jgi:hypothetical protein
MKRAICIRLVLCSLCAVPIAAAPAHAAGADSPPNLATPTAGPAATSTATVTASSPAPATPPAAKGFAVELSTGGLSGGALGIGWGAGRFAAGVAVDIQHSSLTGPDQGTSTPELTETAIALGPWLRWDMARALDGRVGLLLALDLEYGRQSMTTKIDASPTASEASASGVIFRLGPGIRYWATPWMAVGYMTQLSISSLSGPLLAFTPSTTLAPSTYEFNQFQLALVGRFSVLALF